jgi:hypothetical protein
MNGLNLAIVVGLPIRTSASAILPVLHNRSNQNDYYQSED